ncbi:zona occludens toxin [Rhodoferax sp. OV413]|uniref:zonular occludens toxin domain-containing protein n=1 Tax=Rhodoferax sp. OV413 TaxID=1855285 RepID=UPI000889FCD7|nr:zonular occludens toxin domain-containing protein [Rhodoferax sp. OV413]SDO07958.1 zona occludens toxin [Rhodoferax sp. OV413]
MLYLRTGANGAGKTLLTLRDVREKSLAESRPVYYNGRFNMVADFGWIKIDAKDWESVPDGAIFLFDECHNDFPIRSGKEVPRYVSQLAEHRVRGFDFFLLTQHPMNMDPFVRRLIGSPGWHQHLKRASGAPLVSVIQWAAVNDAPQKAGSGASGQVTMVKYPKEVYDWYVSTSLDTAKVRIPFQVKLLVACVVLVPLLGYYAWTMLQKTVAPKGPVPVAQPLLGQVRTGGPDRPPGSEKRVLTTAEYVSSYQPRLQGLAYTAPRYDEMTKPVNVPYPAACIQSKTRCECFSQQATKLDVPLDLCAQLVKGGFFNDWQAALKDANAGRPLQESPVAVAAAPHDPLTLPKQTRVLAPPLRPVLPTPAPAAPVPAPAPAASSVAMLP